ncbi:hypothetical protein DFH06DRAFT_1019121 [Mycena polygramma]|nr:hypothetical protein DFH06DRAFT_1023591 [Mycena polygramma]KAJ7606766.1 hypothetical protein DFH06DRAFT_1019121 [Mycena polygramma]
MPSAAKPAWSSKTANRPLQLSLWVKAGRGIKPTTGRPAPMAEGRGPPIASLAVYGADWWRWWAKVQPEWRVQDTGRRERFVREQYPAATRANWGDMRHPGPNGALSFVSTLYWWGKALGSGEQEDRESWADAVRDVRWVLKGLLAAERAMAASKSP